ncbi:MAG: DUF177 domain-containing protein [Nannocystaceae bacterium]
MLERPASAPGDALRDLRVSIEALASRDDRACTLEGRLEARFVDAALEDTDGRARGDGKASLEIVLHADDTVRVQGKLSATYEVPCARCLEAAVVRASTEVCVEYVPSGRNDAAGGHHVDDPDNEIELSGDEVDEAAYDGRFIDLAPFLQEQLQLTYPIRALCVRGERCRGLCPHCGRDLNSGGKQFSCVKCGARCSIAPDPPSASASAAIGGHGGSDTPDAPDAPDTGPVPEAPAWKQQLRKLSGG